MYKLIVSTAVVGAVLFAIGCGPEKTPSRNQFPLIKETVFTLQEAVKERRLAAIDSLLSPKILDKGQSSDSLVRYCFGPDADFDFRQFGRCEIRYTDDYAEADCFVMDSTVATDRPIRLSFVHERFDSVDVWLLYEFAPFEPPIDSLPAEEPSATE